MIAKLTPEQIVLYWNVIRFASIKAEMVEKKNEDAFVIDFLFRLLSGEYECFISLSDTREIQRILIVSFRRNEVQRIETMFFHVLYSFSHGSPQEWAYESEKIYNYAKSRGCSRIDITTKNEKIIELAETYGFEWSSANFTMSV